MGSGPDCVRGMRVTVAYIVNLVANGTSVEQKDMQMAHPGGVT